jgi:hypothetical protein
LELFNGLPVQITAGGAGEAGVHRANSSTFSSTALNTRYCSQAHFSAAQREAAVLRDFYIQMLPENSVRQGFLQDEDYSALLTALPEYLRALFAVAYETGIRKVSFDSFNGHKWISTGG